jgi:hypothetical protein
MLNIRLAVPEWVLKRWILVAYLLVDPDSKISEIIAHELDEAAIKAIHGYLKGYVEKGVMPPAAIAPAIINMADDYMAGRQITMRTGDYYALQSHMRAGASARKE